MKNNIKNIIIIILGVLFVAVGVNMFLAPHNIAAGGVSGIGVLAEAFIGIDKSIVVLVLNILMLILTAIFLDKETLVKILFGSILLPIFLAIVPEIKIVDDQMLSMIFGSGIFAVGVAFMYQIGASSGGTTVPPMIFKKFFRLNVSIGLLLTDLIVVLFNILVFNLTSFFFAVLSLIITSIVMIYVETGLNRKKALMIISKDHIEEIKNALLSSVERGGTLFRATGADTGAESYMLLMIVDYQNYRKSIDLVKSYDKDAFIVSYNIADVHGIGFTYQNI